MNTIPGFTAQYSLYESTPAASTPAARRSASPRRHDAALRPALLGDDAPGPAGCVADCVELKGWTTTKCKQYCASGGTGGPGKCDKTSEAICLAGVTAWEAGCWASIFGGPWCSSIAASKRSECRC
jgi:hypothetical protein